MYFVDEETVQSTVRQSDVTPAIAQVFESMATGAARNFPVVRETLNHANAIFGFKSGFDRTNSMLGVKAGGLWPGNRAADMANHQSTILLFDPDTGAPAALVRGNFLTALRTAASSALSIRYLARKDAVCLGILGGGGQAEFQIRAALMERPFTEIAICCRSEASAEMLASRLDDVRVRISICDPQQLAHKSDVLITVTPSFEPVIKLAWLKEGVHLACMGADTKGKQELDTDIVANAVLFGDEPIQNISIGECQHAYAAGRIAEGDICKIGDVIRSARPGRTGNEQITLFDSTGVGLQDVAAASLALRIALERNLAVKLG